MIDIGSVFLGIALTLLCIAGLISIFTVASRNDAVSRAEDCLSKYRTDNDIEHLYAAKLQIQVAIIQHNKKARQDLES